MAHEIAPLQAQMKVLYVSGYSDSDISEQGVITPGLVVLQKPFTQDILTGKVHEILDNRVPAPPAL